jgi:hypothetical protein
MMHAEPGVETCNRGGPWNLIPATHVYWPVRRDTFAA